VNVKIAWYNVRMSQHTHMIDLSDLPEAFASAIEAAVRAYREQTGNGHAGARSIGWAKDMLPELPESFFDPLPRELLDLFDGKHT
jgi:hypothetical protein